MSTVYGAAYNVLSWHPVAIGITPKGAVDAAIRMYDDSGSLEPYGWSNEWSRSKKAEFLRARGMRVKKFKVTMVGQQP